MKKKILCAILVAALAVAVAVPVLANNNEVHVKPIDIKPTSCPNPLNVRSGGVLPVAVLGFEWPWGDLNPQGVWDPYDEVDVSTVRLEGVAPLRWDHEDVATPWDGWYPGPPVDCNSCTTAGPDGFLDLTLKFDIQDVVAALEANLGRSVKDGECIVLYLTGEYDGGYFWGQDVVKIIKKGRNSLVRS